jgi:hypothetical protein
VTTEDASLPISGRVDEASAESRARAAASAWVVEDAKGREIFRRSWAMRGRLGGIDGLVLAPGRYGVRLERPGTAPATAAVEIAEGEHVRQTLGDP